MALTPQQEAALARIADVALAQEAYDLKVAEMDTVRAAAQAKVDSKLLAEVRSKTGPEQKQAIRDLQSAIAADPEVTRLESEAAVLKADIEALSGS